MKTSWWRKIPHPSYGNWGGRTNTHEFDGNEPKPIDKLDKCFLRHDKALRHSKSPKGERQADKRLHRCTKKVKVKGIYANLYRIACIIIFKRR